MSYQENKLMNLKDGRLLLETLDVAGRIAGSIAVTDNTEASVKTLTDGAENLPMEVTVAINPIQDLHWQEYPWAGGAGKNLCPYMTKENQDQGITTTLNDDGTVVVNGSTPNSAKFYAMSPAFEVQAGISYVLSGCPSGGSLNSYRLDIRKDTTADLDPELSIYDYGSGVTFTPTTTHNIRISVRLAANYTASNLKFYPMVRVSSASATYEPYSNICPISGWDSVQITRTGKNLVFKKIENTNIDANGRLTQTDSYAVHIAQVKANVTYATSGNTETPNGYVIAFFSSEPVKYDYSYNRNRTISTTGTTFTAPIDGYVALRSYPADTSVQIEIGSTASAYEPYTGNVYPISLPTTAYGGTLTVNKDGSGTLIADVAISTITGSASGASFDSGSTRLYLPSSLFPGIKGSASSSDLAEKSISNQYELVTLNETYSHSKIGYGISSTGNVYIYNPALTSFEAWKTSFDTTNLQIVYALVSPVSIDFTASQIRSLLGVNNVFADSGNVLSVVYYADTKMYIDAKIAELQALVLENT